MFRRQVTFGLVLLCLAIGWRTFVIQGMLWPVAVHGDSMAPWAVGEQIELQCPACDHLLWASRWQVAQSETLACPACQAWSLVPTGSQRAGQRLTMDRGHVSPQRWQTIVLHPPHNAASLSIKRVVGLPGEQVAFAEGDLWINGERVAKPWNQQQQMRRLEHSESATLSRWTCSAGTAQLTDAGWKLSSGDQIRYRQPVWDDLPQNIGLSRRFNAMTDLAIEVQGQPTRHAILLLACGKVSLRLDAHSGTLCLAGPNESAVVACRWQPAQTIGLSLMDKLPRATIQGRVVAQLQPLAELKPGSPSVQCQAGNVLCQQLTLWKDIYYEPNPAASGSAGDQPWQLAADEYFVVGDNQAVSLDSRNWPPRPGVPRRLVVGVVRGVVRGE